VATHPACVCGCARDEHRVAYEFGTWNRIGCRVHRSCTRYQPAADEAQSEHERVLTAVAEVCTKHAVEARAELGEPIVVGPAGAVPAGPVLTAYDAWACEGCGSRYWIAYTDHPCGPLTPVTVTISRRPA
jgi:hypothetical protein